MKKLYYILFIAIIVLMLFPSCALASSGNYTLTKANTDGSFLSGGASFDTYADAYSAFSSDTDVDAVILGSNGKIYAMKRGMVITASDDSTLVFTNTYPGGISSYVSNASVCYFLGINSSATVSMRIASYHGTADISQVILIPAAHTYPLRTGDDPRRYEFDFYTKDSSGNLLHYLSTYSSDGYTTFSSITIDKAPEFMATDVRYYSTDSFHYFTDPYDAIQNSISSPSYAGFHCVYYKYLSFRSKTSYPAEKLNSFIAYKNATYRSSVTCAYLGLGADFLSAQNTYGANAVLELAFANHESAYGKSGYAVNRHNIFGMNAVDSNPDDAYYFTSTAECIRQHAYYTLSRGYFDAKTDSRYFGSNAGDKGSGVNAKYASDPWHGEKIASHAYAIDSYLGGSDYGRYTIGMTNGYAAAYKSASTDSGIYYTYTAGKSDSTTEAGMAVVILGESGDFYIVQSDMPITESGDADYTAEYSYERSIAYVLKNRVDLVYVSSSYTPTPGGDDEPGETEQDNNLYCFDGAKVAEFLTENNTDGGYARVYKGETPVTTGNFSTGMSVKYYASDDSFISLKTIVVYADLNGDGGVDTTDLVIMRRYLAGLSVLNNAEKAAANINKDSFTDTTDLVVLRRYLAGLTNIKE